MATTSAHPYATHLDIKFPVLSVVDVPRLVKDCTDQWYNQTLCRVNDAVVRLGVLQGEITGTSTITMMSSSSSWTVTSSSISKTSQSIFRREKASSCRRASFTAPVPPTARSS